MKKILFSLLLLITSTTLFSQIPVIWSLRTIENKDNTIDLIFDAEIESPWYMYNSTKFDNGPLPTNIDVASNSKFKLLDIFKDNQEAKYKFDEAFDLNILVFEKNGSFIQRIERLSSESFTVEGVLTYQVCNGRECLMDEYDFKFNIPASTSFVESTTSTTIIPNQDSSSSSQSQGMALFLIIAFVAGLGGVFTPCVFPMIPMTVSFFISGSSSKKAGILKGVIFGISVTAIYTLIGVLVSLFQSTDATDVLSTHWIPNLIFSILFLIFAISFFGAFEITLPSGLANKADARADKGGYIASFFVAFAMVIVSFSCTGPFVGSILAAAVTGGVALKPILGMLVFGLAFSLPFVVFSFFPSLMKKMPKSGGWLNVVKVVFAFILLAFSLKFLSMVDIYFGYGIINRSLFISSWIAISIIASLYLLGMFNTSHDSPSNSVGTFRIVLAITSLSFALYLVPGLFGAPLNSLSGILPSLDGSTQFISSTNTTSNNESSVTKGLCGEAKYATVQNRAPHNLNSYYTISEAIECAISQNKPILLSFKSKTCSACKVMEANVWSKPEILDILNNKVVIASLYVDDRSELPESEQIISSIDGKLKNTLGRYLRDYQLSRFSVASQPYYVLIDHSQNILTTPVGECSVQEFKNFLESGIEAFYK